SPEHSPVDEEQREPDQQCRDAALESELQGRRVQMPPRNLAALEHAPLAPMPLERIHADADEQMARPTEQHLRAFAPDDQTPSGRAFLRIDETDLALLMQDEETGERERQSDGGRNQ